MVTAAPPVRRLGVTFGGELEENVVSKNFLHTTQHGAIEGKTQTKEVK